MEEQDGALELYYLPPYSPELNPDDLVWNDLTNKALGRKVNTSREGLRNLAISHLRRLESLDICRRRPPASDSSITSNHNSFRSSDVPLL